MLFFVKVLPVALMSLSRELIGLWRSRSLLQVLSLRELRARYAGSAGGIAWAYAQPLLMLAAYYLVFDIVFAMRLGEGSPTSRVGTYLIVGMLPWMAFTDALTRSMHSLVESGPLLQKNALLAALFPAKAVLSSALVYSPLLIILVLAFASEHHFAVPLLLLPAVLASQLLLTFLLGYVLAIFAAAVRDTLHIVAFVLSVGMFLSPILFPIDMFPEAWRWVLWLNPMTAWVQAYQALLLQGIWPAAMVGVIMISWLALAAATLNVLIRRCKDQLVDWL